MTLIYLGKEFHSGGMTISQTRGFEHTTYDLINGYRHSFSIMGVRTFWYSTAHLMVWCLQNLAETTRLKVDLNGVHLGMYGSTCNQERETSIQIFHGWHLLAIYGQVRMIPTHEQSLPRSFHQNKPTNPQCCSVNLQSFPQWFTLIINYYYPLIFHRFTPAFPRIFLLLAIYSTYISIKIRRSFPGGAKGGADPPCRVATWIPWPWRKTTGGFQHPKCGDFVGFYGGFMVIYGDLAVIFMGCQKQSGLLSSGNPAWPWTIRRWFAYQT